MRVGVIGAGASGLPAIKCCIEEGLDVVCYEKTSEVGGLWNYRPGVRNVGATVMESTVVNTSKELMAYSDFPPPENWPNFMHHTKVNEYLQLYAEKFNLLEKIQFNTQVNMVTRDMNDKYHVKLDSGKVEIFDKLMICTGHHAEPYHPQLNDVHKFKGKIMHAQEYHNTKGFEGKDVFLLGIGNSALDIAVDLAKIAKSVTISTRRGTWIFNRVSMYGMPYDTIYQTRYYDWLMDAIPWTVANDFMEHRLNQRLDHEVYGLKPKHRFFQQHPTVNDALANLICSGYITVTEDIDTFTPNSVIVKNGREFPCDIFITCTGYTFGFPFIDKDILDIQNHEVPLYKYVFPVDNSSISVIGLIQPIGSIAPISEIQCRWTVKIFTDQITLPSKANMIKDIEKKKKVMKRRYFDSLKHTIQVDYIKYMDEIADLIGCRPNIRKYLLSNPSLAVQLIMGPNFPYAYRVEGPNSWAEARKAIEEASERIKRPLKNRQCQTKKHKYSSTKV
ncbi:hypothetical protein WR25_19751 [Diploscapter pachys]|uniref:Flavin-containing monooxygenase n=1 Tax=Diploscapter pachys TaxID=2018661 RepID=A0A2A2LQC9_9BILA|nr:hypothetical protein WR25_19751 [Diploscapter pachys]